MALSKEVPEFDIDDEVLLMETGIAMDSMSNDEGDAPPSVRAKSRHSASLKQHKYIDYTRALDATQLPAPMRARQSASSTVGSVEPPGVLGSSVPGAAVPEVKKVSVLSSSSRIRG
jgi:hypothetical protein